MLNYCCCNALYKAAFDRDGSGVLWRQNRPARVACMVSKKE